MDVVLVVNDDETIPATTDGEGNTTYH